MDLKETLEKLEQDYFRASISADGDFYDRNLSDDALLVFAETGSLDKDACVQAVSGSPGDTTGASWRIEDARLVTLSPDAALISYRAEATRPGGQPASILVASAYSRQDGTWKLAFHQQTVV